MKRIFTLLCLYLAFGNNGSAQTINFHSQFDSSFIPQGNYFLVGRMAENYLFIYSDYKTQTKLIICDKDGTPLKEKSYDFVNDESTVAVNLIPNKESWSLIIQTVNGNMHYTQTVKLNAEGEILQDLVKIDSARYDKLKSAAVYSMTSSRNGNYFLLYRILRGYATGQILLNYLLLDKDANPLGSKSFFIPFDEVFEVLNNIFLAPNGTVYFALHDKALNYRLGSKIRLYKSDLASDQPFHTEIYLKENKPLELAFDSDPENSFVALGALYSNFYSKDVDGVVAAIFNPATNRLDTVVYMTMDKSFKKDLKKGISGIKVEDLVNQMHLKYFRVNPDKSISIVTDLLSSRDYYNVTQTSSSVNNPPSQVGVNGNLMPSQSFDEMRSYIAATTLPSAPDGRRSSSRSPPTGSTGGSNNVFAQQRPTNMGEWNNQMSRLQGMGVTSPSWRNAYDSYFQSTYSSSIRKNTMVMKSIVFSIDQNHKPLWKTWVWNLYIPETPFTTVTHLPINNQVSLINYELTQKNDVFLQQQTFSADGKIISQQLAKPQQPLLFHGGNMLRLGDKEVLTLYFDPVRNKVGLASINW